MRLKGRTIFAIVLGVATVWAFFVLYDQQMAQQEVVITIDSQTTPTNNDAIGDDPVDEAPVAAEDDLGSQSVKMRVPTKVRQPVVFVVQAPHAQWDNELYQDACEEASVLMAGSWISGRDAKYSKEEATAELEKMFAFETKHYGQAYDLSAADTAQFFKDYYDSRQAHVVYDIGVNDIIGEIADGHLVIVPSDGQKLGNPYFTEPGPERHMLVITGYDQKKKEFITNDPGTRRGEDYRYDFETLIAAVRDYPTGHKEPITQERTAMIVIGGNPR